MLYLALFLGKNMDKTPLHTSTKDEVDAYVEEVWPRVVRDIGRLVAINSVENLEQAEDDAPFGPGPAAVLELGASMASSLGLHARNDNGRMVVADLEGKSHKQIAILSHLDVVPAGEGWETDPFKLERRDGYLLGRGVVDDKGPAVLSLYAAHYFAERTKAGSESLPYTLRILLGANEETGFKDVEYYNKKYNPPEFLFTPDGWWPLGVGEKGLGIATVTSPVLDGNVVDMHAGSAHNMIPFTATAIVRADWHQLPEVRGIDIIEEGDGLVRLFARGKGGHAATPENTKNPIGMLVTYLFDQQLLTEEEKPFFEFERQLFAHYDGAELGIAATDDLFDPLTCVGGVIRKKDGKFVQTLDIRFPKSITGDELKKRLTAVAEAHGLSLQADKPSEAYWINPNRPEIQALVDTYNEYTGQNRKPFTMGGGTYARCFPHAASFGLEDDFLQMPSWVGAIHAANEGISEQHLKDALAIYILAIERLMQLDW